MKEKKIFTVTDLGGGDGGKGGVVHKLCVEKQAHTVIKVGGAQGSHGVRTSKGQSFNFGQFGCGTFEGVKTHISDLMVIEPFRLLHEAHSLKYEWGLGNVFAYLTIDQRALCVTPFHTIASRLQELARQDKPKGTVGVGVGEAFLDTIIHPDLAIRAEDLTKNNFRDRLLAVRQMKIADLAEIIANVSSLCPPDQKIARDNIELLFDEQFIDRIVAEFNQLGAVAKIVPADYLPEKILALDGVVVVESSHGVLTDRYYGFHPHTSRLRTLPQATWEMLTESCHYSGQIVKLGVTRAYQIRHGAGPMVTEAEEFLDKLLPGSNKDENRWQGKVRVGPLDFVALRYALEVCGGADVFDGLAVTWFDQIKVLGAWPICLSYKEPVDKNFFWSDNYLKVSYRSSLEQLAYQEKLGQELNRCVPNVQTLQLPTDRNQVSLSSLCARVFFENLGVPVRMISFGPTEINKVCI